MDILQASAFHLYWTIVTIYVAVVIHFKDIDAVSHVTWGVVKILVGGSVDGWGRGLGYIMCLLSAFVWYIGIEY